MLLGYRLLLTLFDHLHLLVVVEIDFLNHNELVPIDVLHRLILAHLMIGLARL